MSLADGAETVGDIVRLLEAHDVDVEMVEDVQTSTDGQSVGATLTVEFWMGHDHEECVTNDDHEQEAEVVYDGGDVS